MQGKTHMIIGASASLLLLPRFGYDPGVLTTVAAGIAALVCDIDHPRAKINQKILPVKNKMAKILVYSGLGSFLLYKNIGTGNSILTMVGILLFVIGFSHHRGFTHSLVGVGFMSFIMFMIFKNSGINHILVAAGIGLISHPIADCLTKEGIELLYPVSNKKYRFPLTITTGGIVENLLSGIMILGMIGRFIKI